MSILILASGGDATAQRIATFAAERRSTPVRVVSPLELARARWTHSVGRSGVETTIELFDGTSLRGAELRGVFNRMWSVPLAAFSSFDATDREYAVAELNALLVSWLASLQCPVVNRGSPHALCGSPLSAARWRAAAARVGLPLLPVVGHRDTASRRSYGRGASVLVVNSGTWVTGFDPSDQTLLRRRCLRLAHAAGVQLLRVHFVQSDDAFGWGFVGADAVPDVDETEPLTALLDAIAGAPASRLARTGRRR